jgi:hydrogenase-4 transcriptional activator
VTRQVDVRIIAATNRDLKEEVAAKRFRQDLFYRLSVFPVEIPPLRERVEDIPTLAMHFLQQTCTRLGITQPVLKQRHVMELQAYDWPGNIRELQNVIERAVITAGAHGLQFDIQVSSPERNNAIGPPPQNNVEIDVLTDEEVRSSSARI